MFISAPGKQSAAAAADQLELSIARSKLELEAAFRLVYNSYLRSGLTTPNPLGMRLTRFHLLPTTEVMLAKSKGDPVATASLILDGELGLPAEAIYAAEIDRLRSRGLRLAEVGCLCDRRESPARFIRMFRQLSTLIAQAAAFRGCHGLIAAAHPKHARFYIRQLGFQQVGEEQPCPYVQGNPAVALLMDFEQLRGSAIHRHLFGNPYADEELISFDWDRQTQAHFEAIHGRIQPQLPESKPLPAAASIADMQAFASPMENAATQ